MAQIEHQLELSRAGANVHGRLGQLLFFCRRYPLGAIGGILVLLFVLAAVFADQIAAHDPLTIAVAAGLVLFIGICACVIPARRALRVQPIAALREE